MMVEVTELSYVAEGKEFVRAVNTGAALRVISKLGSSTFTKTFRDSSRKEVLKAPSEEDNTKLLSADLSRALARVVASGELTGDP